MVRSGRVGQRGPRSHWLTSESGRSHVLADGTSPSWSPNGRELALAHDGWIWVVSTISGRGRRLARGAAPAFAPDGSRVAYIGSGHRVEIVAVSGGPSHPVGDLRGDALAWQPQPTEPQPSCQTPAGATRLADSGGTLLYAFSPSQLYGAGGTAVMSCLSSQRVPRLVARDFQEDCLPCTVTAPLGAVNGNAVATVFLSSQALIGVQYDTEYVVGADAATGIPLPPSRTYEACGSSETAPPDSDVFPASVCGINDLVVNPSGVWAFELTELGDNCDTTSGCWSQSVLARGPQGDTTLAQVNTDGPTGQSGITDLMAGTSTLSWEDNGTPESAPY